TRTGPPHARENASDVVLLKERGTHNDERTRSVGRGGWSEFRTAAGARAVRGLGHPPAPRRTRRRLPAHDLPVGGASRTPGRRGRGHHLARAAAAPATVHAQRRVGGIGGRDGCRVPCDLHHPYVE